MKYKDAIRNALVLAMQTNPRVFVMGLGVADPKGVFGSTLGLVNEFGTERVFDIPLSENAIVGVAIGAAMQGMRPVMVNQRIDFLWLALDQIANHAAKWRCMFGDSQRVPIVIRAIVGRGWGQGGQHSQSLHATFAHIPGLIVIAPSSPYDMKGMLLSALEGDNPVLCIEHRWLYEDDGSVPDGVYTVPLGKAAVLREGTDITIVATSQMVIEAKKAVKALETIGVSPELIDLRSLNPMDADTLATSVAKTGRLVVADGDWRNCGISAEVVATVVEHTGNVLKAPPVRITWPEVPTPTSVSLEKAFYKGAVDIYQAAVKMLGYEGKEAQVDEAVKPFLGPF
jgi:pyruvate dehydrogenase E1 component beta subunit